MPFDIDLHTAGSRLVEAIAAVLAAHGEQAGGERVDRLRRGLGARDRLAPYLHGLARPSPGGPTPRCT